LMDHYCQSETRTEPTSAASGLPLVTVFDPTGDYSKYPGRSTLEETYTLIESDLKDAYDDLSAYEKSLSTEALAAATAPNAAYLNTYVVLAFQARMALLKGDYQTAIDKAEAVISNTQYALATRNTYGTLWTDDRGTELIFVPYGNAAQADYVPTTGEAWLTSKEENANYVAAANALAMYDPDNDVRYEWFFADRELSVEGSYAWAPAFVKFPGNGAFNLIGNNELRNLPKPFRLSETYLILAEAAAELGQTTKANDALNHIRTNRIKGYKTQSYQGRELIEEIRTERTRELIGEGFRISDLRRWNLGFSRSIDYESDYEETVSILVPAGCNVSYAPGDRRFVWPIPKSEMEANPQLAGQQNPGY
ncbi:MAG: RagB/SusD family nutrient uptake outer membrane protein, partial [Muribaculaceae bacterium]|nr:RagB/SusD family nutrient uptake outer membrane protein [Muribaculaceae bacterium]